MFTRSAIHTDCCLECLGLSDRAKKNVRYRDGLTETLAYTAFPREHWWKIRTTNPLERIMREIRRRTRVVGAFPDGNAAVLLVAARPRHIAGTHWGTKQYMDMKRLQSKEDEAA